MKLRKNNVSNLHWLIALIDFKFLRVFNENEDWKFWWDLFVLLIAIWNSLSIPVAVSFSPDWANEQPYTIIDVTSNILFLFDILILFNTSYYDVEGEEVKDRKRIA